MKRVLAVVALLAPVAACYGNPFDANPSWVTADASVEEAGDERVDEASAPFDGGAANVTCLGTDGAAPGAGTPTGAFLAAGFALHSMTSQTGSAWTDHAAPPSEVDAGAPPNIVQMASRKGLIVAAAERGLYTSTDGADWTYRPVPNVSQYVAYDNGYTAVAFGDDTFAAAVSAKFNDLVFYSSPDGVQWSLATHIMGHCCVPIRTMAYANGRFVAAGDEKRTLVSTNGVQWTDEKFGASDAHFSYLGLAYGKGTWVAVGKPSILATSPDGVQWTDRGSPAIVGNFRSVAFDGNRFVTCAEWACFSSPDGVQWTRSPGADTDPRPTTSILYADGLFVGLGVPMRVVTSSDGLTWHPAYCGAPPELVSLLHVSP